MAANDVAGAGHLDDDGGRLLQTLIARHSDEVRGLCRLYVGAQDADDAAQEVWLAVVRKLWQLDDEDRALGWLRVLTFHRCLDFRRRRARRHRVEVALGDDDWRGLAGYVAGDEVDLADLLEGRRLRELIDAHLDRMPQAFGSMLRLRYLDGLSQSEIAATTGVAVGTVKWRLHHARHMLLADLAATVREPLAGDRRRRRRTDR